MLKSCLHFYRRKQNVEVLLLVQVPVHTYYFIAVIDLLESYGKLYLKANLDKINQAKSKLRLKHI